MPVIVLHLLNGAEVIAPLDGISYIVNLSHLPGPCKTRVHFSGDKANSIDVVETSLDILRQMSNPFTIPDLIDPNEKSGCDIE